MQCLLVVVARRNSSSSSIKNNKLLNQSSNNWMLVVQYGYGIEKFNKIHHMTDVPLDMSDGWIWSKTFTYCSMSVVPFRPFHACMNSKAVTLLSCGGWTEADDEWDEDEVLDSAVTELSSVLTEGTVVDSTGEIPDTVADVFVLASSALFNSINNITK